MRAASATSVRSAFLRHVTPIKSAAARDSVIVTGRRWWTVGKVG
jgi:hypothetical protein